jgi:hypothetical protein
MLDMLRSRTPDCKVFSKRISVPTRRGLISPIHASVRCVDAFGLKCGELLFQAFAGWNAAAAKASGYATLLGQPREPSYPRIGFCARRNRRDLERLARILSAALEERLKDEWALIFLTFIPACLSYGHRHGYLGRVNVPSSNASLGLRFASMRRVLTRHRLPPKFSTKSQYTLNVFFFGAIAFRGRCHRYSPPCSLPTPIREQRQCGPLSPSNF